MRNRFATCLSFVVGTLLVASASAAPPRTFYVDAERGNDARDGGKPESAWRSLAKVNHATLAPGDRVLFRRGQSWRGQLAPRSGNATGVITYGAFGEGTKPILLGSVAADRPEDWQPAGEGLWQTLPLRFEPMGVQADLTQVHWTLHQEGGASCSLAHEKQTEGGNVLRLTCRNPGTRSNHLQLFVSGLTVAEGEYYLFTFRAKATRAFTPASVSLMQSGPPWNHYASAESGLTPIGTDWTEHTVRFHATQSATDARITLFLGGVLHADSTLLLRPVRLEKARCNQAIPLSVDWATSSSMAARAPA